MRALGLVLLVLSACDPEPQSSTCALDPTNRLACGPITTQATDPGDPACTASEPEQVDLAVELGAGERSFEPLGQPAVLDIHTGFQGGYHALASIQVEGLRDGVSSDLALAYWIATGPACAPSEANPSAPFYFGELVPAGCDRILGRSTFSTYGGALVDGTFTYPGAYVMFGEVRPAPGPALLGVWVQDRCGRTATSMRAVELR